jgi:hypothetical protein
VVVDSNFYAIPPAKCVRGLPTILS